MGLRARRPAARRRRWRRRRSGYSLDDRIAAREHFAKTRPRPLLAEPVTRDGITVLADALVESGVLRGRAWAVPFQPRYASTCDVEVFVLRDSDAARRMLPGWTATKTAIKRVCREAGLIARVERQWVIELQPDVALRFVAKGEIYDPARHEVCSPATLALTNETAIRIRRDLRFWFHRRDLKLDELEVGPIDDNAWTVQASGSGHICRYSGDLDAVAVEVREWIGRMDDLFRERRRVRDRSSSPIPEGSTTGDPEIDDFIRRHFNAERLQRIGDAQRQGIAGTLSPRIALRLIADEMPITAATREAVDLMSDDEARNHLPGQWTLVFNGKLFGIETSAL